jgi:hypothetical protein
MPTGGKMKQSKRRKKAQIGRDLHCPLCKRDSSSLKLRGFCFCVTTFEDFHEVKGLGRMIIPSRIQALKEKYLKTPKAHDYFEAKKIKEEKKKIAEPVKIPTRTRIEKNEFYQSWEWATLRMKILNKYGRKCMSCNDNKGKICVDHIKPLHTHWSLRLDETNLQVLCDLCNKGKSIETFDFRPTVTKKLDCSKKM